jgi:hypothetical protein
MTSLERRHQWAGVAAVVAFLVTLVVLGRAFNLSGNRAFVWLIPAAFVAALVWNWLARRAATSNDEEEDEEEDGEE